VLTNEAAKRLVIKYVPISLASLRVDTDLDFDLFIKVNGEFVLYRASDMQFTEKTRQLLIDNKVTKLYVSSAGRTGYQKYIEGHLNEIINDESISEAARTTILYDTAKLLVMDVLSKPTDVENLGRSLSLVETTVMHSLMSQNAVHNMIEVMAFDYTTYTHSVNVCTFSIALAQFSGMDDALELRRLGVGALLHDIGKTRIPEEILNKPDELSPGEWRMMQNHPQWGFEMVLESDVIPHEAMYPILQHHERDCGSGYPHGIKADEIHPLSKIVAIADVFDAMTTKRAHRQAVGSFPALSEMFSSEGAFDQKLLRNFTKMMGQPGDSS
jgi:putative nucleotidyltransferase with HDIG domain